MTSPTTTTTGTKTGRARRRLGQLWQAPTFFCGLFLFIGVAASAPWRQSPWVVEFDAQLTKLREGLEHDADPDGLVRYAEAALVKLPMYRWRVAEVHFLAGSAYYRQALAKPVPVAKEIWPRAVEHLDKALSLNSPEPDRPALQYRLGYSLYRQNDNWPRAIELMTASVEKGAENPLDGYLALADANQKLARPNLDAAVYALRRVIDLTPESKADDVAEARILYAQLLIRRDQRPEAIKELDKISMRTRKDLRVKARLLQASACMDVEHMAYMAVPIWQELRTDAAHVEGGRAFIQYQLGWAHHKTRPQNIEQCKLAWADALVLGGPAGQAAGLRLGEFKLSLDPVRNADDAIKDWRKALDKVKSSEEFRNPYIESAEVVELLANALKIVEPDTEKAQAVAELYRKVARGSDGEKPLAYAAEARAKELAKKLDGKSGVTLEQVQSQYRRAAEAFQNAAKLCNTSERNELAWRAIQCCREAKDDVIAQKLLQQYLVDEQREAPLAEGWFTLGDIYLAEGKKEDAYKALTKCLQYPDTLFAYRARYLLAVMEIDQKKYEQARTILDGILAGNPDIDRAAHEKAIYKMGSLLMLMEDFGTAEAHLRNAVYLYPENALNYPSRLQLGDCHRRLAAREAQNEKAARDKITPAAPEDLRGTLEEAVRTHRKNKIELLQKAVKTYIELKDLLDVKGRAAPLDGFHQTLMRRARFGIGDCHREGEDFPAAVSAFREVQIKHRQTVESIYASARICWIVQVMRPATAIEGVQFKEQAMESIRMLLDDLKEMPENHEAFRPPNTINRAGWIATAQKEQQRLREPPKKETPKAFP